MMTMLKSSIPVRNAGRNMDTSIGMNTVISFIGATIAR